MAGRSAYVAAVGLLTLAACHSTAFAASHWHSRGLHQSGLDCADILSKKTVVVYPGPETPYLGDLTLLMPTHTVDISKGAVGLLPLSQPAAAACARTITDIKDTMMVFEDGNLTQYQDALPHNLVNPTGQLIVKGKDGRNVSGLTDLSFLKSLQSVGGLSVYNMDGLRTLSGLDNLTNITGDLIISENGALRNLTGLDALTSIKGDLLMNSNMNLRTLDGLGSLESVGRQLLVKGNGYLMNTDPLTNLRRVGTTASFPNNGNVQIQVPPGVAVGPNAVVQSRPTSAQPGGDAGGVLVIYGGPVPPPFSSVLSACDTYMPPLSKFDLSIQRTRFHPADQPVPPGPLGALLGNVVVYDDGTIASLRPSLGGITSVQGSLVVVGGKAVGLPRTAPGLQSLAGLEAIQSLGELGVVGATQLTDFTGLNSLQNITRGLVVIFCPNLTSLAGLGGPVTAAGGGLIRTGAEVWLEDLPSLRTLTGMEGLIDVGWRFSIRSCKNLVSLDGLRSLRRTGGGLALLDNTNLTSSAGLASLRSVGGGLHLMYNTKLQDVLGLSRLTRLLGDLALAGNPITSLTPLQNLQSVGLNLVLSHTNVTDLTGLSSLTTVGGAVSVTGNRQLTSLAGLGALSQIGDDLSVRDNAVLNSLAQLDTSLKTVGGGVYVEDNPALTSLGRLPQTLTGAGGVAVVRRNGAIPSSQVASLQSKAGRAAGVVPDTVVLLPSLQRAAQQQQAAYPTEGGVMMMPTVVAAGNSTAAPRRGNVSNPAASTSNPAVSDSSPRMTMPSEANGRGVMRTAPVTAFG